VLAGREIRAIFRQRRIAVLHRQLALAHETDDRDLARAKVGELVALYKHDPRAAAARKELNALRGEIVDGRDLIDIAERKLMPPLDDAARKEIADAAKRVSVVSAISPRALVDVIFVAAQALRLIRRIAEIYGGRPGMLGAWRLARAVGAHLAITGGMAVGDSLLQQVLGHGIASKISARLGEGVLNGLLTARIGVSAMSVCRPMPFFTRKPPGIGEVAPFLIGGDKNGKNGDAAKTS
jgi:putative membrane protein